MNDKFDLVWDKIPEHLRRKLVINNTGTLNLLKKKIFKQNTDLFRPAIIRIETINICNYSCIFCGKQHAKRKKEIMDLKLFEKIIKDYCDIGGGYISLTPQIGEIFSDPLLIERMNIIKKYDKITSVSITTNAVISLSMSSQDLLTIVNGLKRIHISIYGLDEKEHSLITGKNDFDEVIEAVKRLYSLAPEKIYFGFRLLKERPQSFIQEWIEEFFGNPIPFGYTTHYATMGGSFDETSNLPYDAKWTQFREKKDLCINPIFDLRIFSNGSVSFCCSGDSDNAEEFNLGNIRDISLLSIYNSEKARKLQDNKSCRCKKCNYYSPISENIESMEHWIDEPIDFIGG